MFEATPFPEDYSPFPHLKVCGNELINGRVPLSVDGIAPFLIGKGKDGEPLLWLNILTSTGWGPLLRASRTLHKDVSIERGEDRSWRVLVKDRLVLEVSVSSETTAEVTRLDLRPTGLDVFGDSSGLHVGSTNLHGNVFRNVETMIAIGKTVQSSMT